MKYSTFIPVSALANAEDIGVTTSHQRKDSSATNDIQTMTLSKDTSAILVTVETTAARVTIDGSDPSAASAPSMVIQAGQNPILIPIGQGGTVKHVSTAAAHSILQVCELN